jgi:hypothetical protein
MFPLPRPTFRLPRLFWALALAAIAVGFVGCDEDDSAIVVTAVQPFYTQQDVNTDATLLGTWQYEDEVSFTFTPGENGAYTVIVDEHDSDKRFTSRFEGHLFHLGADSFLDLYPTSVPEGSEFYVLHFFRCHTAIKVAFRGDQFEMRFLSPTWLAKQIKAGAVSVAHAKSPDILLLTGSTQEMQDLLFLNASDQDAFGEAMLFEQAFDQDNDQDQDKEAP